MTELDPWYRVAVPRDEVRQGRSFNPDEFAIHLEQVVAKKGTEDYRDPAKFFLRNVFTRALNRQENTMARTPIHPGEILGDELQEIGLSAKKLADLLDVPGNRLYQILSGHRNVTADTALRLGRYFGTSADFWMNLQSAYELDRARQQIGKDIQRIPKRSHTPAETRQHL